MKNHGIAFFKFETADIFNDLFLNISKKRYTYILYLYIYGRIYFNL